LQVFDVLEHPPISRSIWFDRFWVSLPIANGMPFAFGRGVKRNTWDVAVVGGGPAGLSAALLLARSRRSVVVCDDGHPRNYAAKLVNGYLGLEGFSPSEIRKLGIAQCESYGVTFVNGRVTTAALQDESGLFRIELEEGDIVVTRKVLVATGMKDDLPKIKGFHEFYGTSVHHCPYCDGWEHRDQRLVAIGKGSSAAELAVTLRNWSKHVTCCSNGETLDTAAYERLDRLGINHRAESITELRGVGGQIREVHFSQRSSLECDALFFSAGQNQRSPIPQMLGCECDEDGLLVVKGKQGSGTRGLFLAGDADGDVQFAIVAAAEGAIAATAINKELIEEDGRDLSSNQCTHAISS
jgi:thioredoxin reductase